MTIHLVSPLVILRAISGTCTSTSESTDRSLLKSCFYQTAAQLIGGWRHICGQLLLHLWPLLYLWPVITIVPSTGVTPFYGCYYLNLESFRWTWLQYMYVKLQHFLLWLISTAAVFQLTLQEMTSNKCPGEKWPVPSMRHGCRES